jgi:hypothetical protein
MSSGIGLKLPPRFLTPLNIVLQGSGSLEVAIEICVIQLSGKWYVRTKSALFKTYLR